MASVAEIIRDEIRALAAYHVPDSAGMIKLDAMENPYRLPAPLARELGEICAQAPVNRYPDPSGSVLRARLREAMAVPAGAEIMLGNGSDELIQILALACARPGAVIMGLEPSFVMYRMIAACCGMRYVGVPLRPDFSLDEAALLEALAEHRPALLFLAYPNNPTGNLFDEDALLRVIAAAPGLAVVDEAYHAFAGRSFLPRVAGHERLLVMRTLSKLGLAGLRLGFLVGEPRWLAEFDKVRLPYNVSALTQAVAERVLRERKLLDSQALAIREERATLMAELKALPGVQPFPSDANFILFRVHRAGHLFELLKQKGILIKNLDGGHPLLAGCLRVTVGTPEENAAFVAALSDALKAQ